MGRRWVVVLALVACRARGGAGTSDLVASASPAVATATPSAAPAPSAVLTLAAPASVHTDWCVDGLSALDEDVCYVLPNGDGGSPRRLLVYLPGIVPPAGDSPQKRTVERAVLRASLRAGVAAMIPRGRRGIGPARARDWWAWPTTSAAIAALAPSMVARWATAKKKLEEIVGAPFERTYLAGSSSGAYFLAALAVRGELPSPAFPVDGFGAMSGGAAAGRVSNASPRPFYVGFGTYDEETRSRARALAAALETARWPVRAVEHPLGHGAHEVYLDEAFAFWLASDAVDAPDSGR